MSQLRGAALVGCLIWYDEPVAWLMASIASVAPALDHVVVVDGAYLLYPGALRRPVSPIEQTVAVAEACNAAGLSFTLARPSTPWMENEVGKRQYALELALLHAKPYEGWVLVWDADQVARPFSAERLRQDLAEADDHAAAEYGNVQARVEVDGIDHGDDGYAVTRVRGIYRALPGLAYGPAHWTVSAPLEDGGRLWLWGNPTVHTPYASAADVSQALVFDNRNVRRSPSRARAAAEYYRKRDAVGAERLGVTVVEGLDGKPVPVPRQN